MTKPEFYRNFNEALRTYGSGPVSDTYSKSWEKAKARGIFDGTNPRAFITREQMALVLHRLSIIS